VTADSTKGEKKVCDLSGGKYLNLCRPKGGGTTVQRGIRAPLDNVHVPITRPSLHEEGLTNVTELPYKKGNPSYTIGKSALEASS